MIPAYNYFRRLRYVNDESDDNMVKLRRGLRDSSNVLEMADQEFRSNFRMDKACFSRLLDDVAPWMKRGTRLTAIPPILKLSSFLRFLATGSYQKAVGNEHLAAMTQSRVSANIHECLDIFERHICPQWINFEMSEEEERIVKESFYNKYGLPGVIGCVDGTHIKIMSPGELGHLYYNRKGYYSINAMIICDANMIIRYVDGRAPGANHDAYVWRISAADAFLKSAYNSGRRNTWLLGDSGYQLLPYLMTPFRQPQHRSEILFNNKLTKARNIVERCFGVLKNRFRCIHGERGLHYTPHTTTKIINACCALHNICIYRRNYWELEEETELPDLSPITDEEEAQSGAALVIRAELARSLL